jgi:hypothetical protein
LAQRLLATGNNSVHHFGQAVPQIRIGALWRRQRFHFRHL